jgi:transposase
LVGEALRRVLDDIAQVAPEWLKPLIQPEWGKRYGRRVDTHRLSKTKRKELAQEIGKDGHFLFKAIYREDTPDEVKQLASVEVLRRIWIQQYYISDDKTYWREKDQYGTPSSQTMIASPDELEARYGSKDSRTWTGYKVHLTETCDETAPRLITQVETTVATTPDASVLENIQDDLIARHLAPESHWVDGGYPNVDVLLSSQEKGIDLIGPMRPDTSWQAQMEDGYDQTKFIIDWENMMATCPEGKTSIHWKEGKTATGRPNIHFAFSLPVCTACPSRHLCTKAKKIGRHITVQHQKAYDIQKAARERQASEGFKELYKRRAGIEGTIAQAVRGKNMRYARYRGLLKTHLQHLGTAAAINLQRIASWFMGDLPKGTRISPFAALVSPL